VDRHNASWFERSGAPAAQRAGQPPEDYEDEIVHLRSQVEMLRRMQVCLREIERVCVCGCWMILGVGVGVGVGVRVGVGVGVGLCVNMNA